VYNAEDRDHAGQSAKAFAAAYGAEWPKAVAKITNDLDVLLDFYGLTGEHWDPPAHHQGAKFENGTLVERPDESTSGDTHAA
jgi:transposase-like protein